MIPHKTARGAAALKRLKVFEGVPPPFDKVKRMVVPEALRVIRLKPYRKFCTVSRLSTEFGWKYNDIVQTLEDKRRAKGEEYYNAKKKAAILRTQAAKNAAGSLTEVNSTLAQYGY